LKVVRAAILREPGKSPEIEDVSLQPLQPDELRIDVHAVGICHTDLSAFDGMVPLPLPTVLGHEGAGVVREIGSEVEDFEPGDHLILSYDHCHECENCADGHPSYCQLFAPLNYFGTRLDGTTTLRQGDSEIYGSWFGQSTFATEAIASQRNAVKVPRELPLEMLAPLSCGLMTGAGAVLNVLRPQAGEKIAIFGLGAVGLSAVMAAAASGCETIVAVDPIADRRDIAAELGATNVIDPVESSDVVWDVMEHSSPGCHYSVDCVGVGVVVRQALEVLRTPGICATLGLAGLENEIQIDQGHLLQGRTLVGVIEGDANPVVFLPKLIDMWQRGEFPIEKLIQIFPFEEIDKAILAARNGSVIKPVLMMR
jgi:aryl-alcohol dehydrogenase